MSRRQVRPPGATKLRRDTARKRIAEADWKEAAKEARAAKIIHGRHREYQLHRRVPADEGSIVHDLVHLAALYEDDVLLAAAERLKACGLDGADWRKVAKADAGMSAFEGGVVNHVQDLITAGYSLEAALELAAADAGVQSQSHDGAVQWAKRAYLRWRDATPKERFPAAGKRRPKGAAT